MKAVAKRRGNAVSTTSILVSNLPANPSVVTTVKAVAACREIYAIREQLVGALGVDDALEALRRTGAIERYVKNKEHKAEASYAARILETAVGAALGTPEDPKDSGARGGRGKKGFAREQTLLAPHDASRFRLMYAHRGVWWPYLDKEFRPLEKHLSRQKTLKYIQAWLRPKANGSGVARIEHCDAINWLRTVPEADLLLSDPPYSTDVDDVGKFAASWLPLALSKLKPTGRALVFIGAYADEFAAYFSLPLPKGWTWGVPHAWAYRNAIGPTPNHDFIRNWQCVLSARGPEANKVNSDRITELLAGFTENAPDGRQDVKYHPWQKPLGLLQRLVRVTTDPGAIVIDPFAGSGSTLLAAKAESRQGTGCDNDADAVATAIERGCDAS